MAWKRIVSVKALDNAGGHFSVSVGGNTIFVAKGKDGYHAMDAVCSHAKCILGVYNADDHTVRCPCHNAKFDLSTGHMLEPPFVAPNAPKDKLGLRLFKIRDNEGFLEVDVE